MRENAGKKSRNYFKSTQTGAHMAVITPNKVAEAGYQLIKNAAEAYFDDSYPEYCELSQNTLLLLSKVNEVKDFDEKKFFYNFVQLWMKGGWSEGEVFDEKLRKAPFIKKAFSVAPIPVRVGFSSLAGMLQGVANNGSPVADFADMEVILLFAINNAEYHLNVFSDSMSVRDMLYKSARNDVRTPHDFFEKFSNDYRLLKNKTYPEVPQTVRATIGICTATSILMKD